MPSHTERHFDTLRDGADATLLAIEDSRGMSVSATDYGGVVTQLSVPYRAGICGDVVPGYDSQADYRRDSAHFCATVGRHGHPIATGTFRTRQTRFSTTVLRPGETHRSMTNHRFYAE